MTTKLLNQNDVLQCIRQFGVFDDFGTTYITGDLWTASADAGASAAQVPDGLHGIIRLTTGLTDNNQVHLPTTAELFKTLDNAPLMAICRMKQHEDTQYDASVVFGLSDGVTAASGFIVDDEAGLLAGKYGYVFYKESGSTAAGAIQVMCHGSAAGFGPTNSTRRHSTTNLTMGTGYATYVIKVEPVSATDKRVTYYYDADGGQGWTQCKDSNGHLIQHVITQTDQAQGTGELQLFAGIKNTSAGRNQHLDIDYMGAWQLRPAQDATGVAETSYPSPSSSPSAT